MSSIWSSDRVGRIAVGIVKLSEKGCERQLGERGLCQYSADQNQFGFKFYECSIDELFATRDPRLYWIRCFLMLFSQH